MNCVVLFWWFDIIPRDIVKSDIVGIVQDRIPETALPSYYYTASAHQPHPSRCGLYEYRIGAGTAGALPTSDTSTASAQLILIRLKMLSPSVFSTSYILTSSVSPIWGYVVFPPASPLPPLVHKTSPLTGPIVPAGHTVVTCTRLLIAPPALKSNVVRHLLCCAQKYIINKYGLNRI